MTLPIALTCGEPAGVGPELAVAARAALGDSLPLFWIGDPRHLPKGTAIAEIHDPTQAAAVSGDMLPVLSHRFATRSQPGQPAAANARGVIEVIERAVALVQAGKAGGVCTAPIHKKALKDGAGFAFPGHTEFLAHLAGVDRVVMMLASPLLRVVPVTIHIPLCDVPAALTADLLEDTLRITEAGERLLLGELHALVCGQWAFAPAGLGTPTVTDIAGYVKHLGLARTAADRLAKHADARAFERGGRGLNGQQIVHAGGPQKVDRHAAHREPKGRASLAAERGLLVNSQIAQQFRAPALHEPQIGGVIDHAGKIGVLVIDANGEGMGRGGHLELMRFG